MITTVDDKPCNENDVPTGDGCRVSGVRRWRSCVPVSHRDHAPRSSVEGLADLSGVTEHGDITTTRSELDEPSNRRTGADH